MHCEFDAPFGEGEDHAEGITVLDDGRSALVLYGTPAGKRKTGRHEIKADVFRLSAIGTRRYAIGPGEVFLLLPAHLAEPGPQEGNDDVAVHRAQVIECGGVLRTSPPGLDELALMGRQRFADPHRHVPPAGSVSDVIGGAGERQPGQIRRQANQYEIVEVLGALRTA